MQDRRKPLEEMTLEELWHLFPVTLSDHSEKWAEWYSDERSRLLSVFPEEVLVSLHHIGSTAVPGIQAKPIVDILAELADGTDMKQIAELLSSNGWRIMSEIPGRISLNKGYTEDGYADRVFHLHLHFRNDTGEVLFRDYLREHPAEAAEYEKLKQKLCLEYRFDRDAYTDAKSEFIRACMQKAVLERTGPD